MPGYAGRPAPQAPNRPHSRTPCRGGSCRTSLVIREGVEPPTHGLRARRSDQTELPDRSRRRVGFTCSCTAVANPRAGWRSRPIHSPDQGRLAWLLRQRGSGPRRPGATRPISPCPFLPSTRSVPRRAHAFRSPALFQHFDEGSAAPHLRGPAGTRTRNPHPAEVVRCQLRYRPIAGRGTWRRVHDPPRGRRSSRSSPSPHGAAPMPWAVGQLLAMWDSRRPARWCAGPPRGWPRPGAWPCGESFYAIHCGVVKESTPLA